MEGEYKYSSTLSVTSALDRSVRLRSRPGRFIPGLNPVPIVLEAGWVPSPVRRGAEIVAPTGIRSRTFLSVASRYIDWAIPARAGGSTATSNNGEM